MNKKKGGLLLSLRKDMNRRAISDRRLEAIFRTLSRHPYIVAAFICLALTGFGSYSYKFLNGVIVCGVFMIIEFFCLRRFLKQLLSALQDFAPCLLCMSYCSITIKSSTTVSPALPWQEQALSCAIPMFSCLIFTQDRMTCGISAARAVTQAI